MLVLSWTQLLPFGRRTPQQARTLYNEALDQIFLTDFFFNLDIVFKIDLLLLNFFLIPMNYH